MDTNTHSRILVIVPAYNEENNISQVVTSVQKDFPRCDILVVDDGSRDKTADVARKCGVKAVRLPVNLGIGGAVQTGLKYAASHGYDCAIQVDGDGQHIPAEIEKILKPVLENSCDMAIGSRYMGKRRYQTPIMRRLGMIFFSLFTSLIIRQKITDTTSGFRALNRAALQYLSENYPVDFPDAEVLVMIHREGFRIKEVPVKMKQRLSGNSSTTTLKSIYYPFKACLAILAILLQENNNRETIK